LDATTVLTVRLPAKGIYPAVNPLDSKLAACFDPFESSPTQHYQVCPWRPRKFLQRYKRSGYIIAILGMDELSAQKIKVDRGTRP